MCLQLYAETAILPLQAVLFRFCDTTQAPIWTDRVPDHVKATVKHIKFNTTYETSEWSDYAFDSLSYACKTLVNLEYVYFRIDERYTFFYDTSALVAKLQRCLRKPDGREVKAVLW